MEQIHVLRFSSTAFARVTVIATNQRDKRLPIQFYMVLRFEAPPSLLEKTLEWTRAHVVPLIHEKYGEKANALALMIARSQDEEEKFISACKRNAATINAKLDASSHAITR